MKILRRYITAHLSWVTFLALFALVALFSFFSLIDELGEVGKGDYGVLQAVLYVLLTMPKLAYELFPIAAVIGSMTVLGTLSRNSELDVIRTSGVSQFELAGLLARSGIILVFIAVLIGELVAPVSEETAQEMRSVAMTEQIALKTRYGLWIRDGNSFINVRKVLPDNRLGDIYIYEFDDANRLRSSSHAETAEYVNDTWILRHIRQSVISEKGVKRNDIKRASWDSLLAPEMINFVIVKPQFLTLWELVHYIDYLKENDQNTQIYEQALWTKLVRPFAILAMFILAVPMVRGQARSTAVGQRVFMGALVGIVFHLCNEVASHLGVVYSLSPALSIALPTVLLYLIILFLLRE